MGMGAWKKGLPKIRPASCGAALPGFGSEGTDTTGAGACSIASLRMRLVSAKSSSALSSRPAWSSSRMGCPKQSESQASTRRRWGRSLHAGGSYFLGPQTPVQNQGLRHPSARPRRHSGPLRLDDGGRASGGGAAVDDPLCGKVGAVTVA